jgi:hypothetical protein
VPIGWSMYSILAYWLKLYGFKDGSDAPLTKWHGPFSYTSLAIGAILI